jgi:hypothetical protein
MGSLAQAALPCSHPALPFFFFLPGKFIVNPLSYLNYPTHASPIFRLFELIQNGLQHFLGRNGNAAFRGQLAQYLFLGLPWKRLKLEKLDFLKPAF